jgi:hypothetical protein
MRLVLFAMVVVLTLGGGDGPGAFAGTDVSVAPRSGGLRQATQEVAPPDLRGFPKARAPDDLGTVTLPDTVNTVKAVFERLPSEIAGHLRLPRLDRISPERASVGYGEDPRVGGVSTPLLWLQAVDVSRERFFPTHWTGAQVVAFMAGRGKEAKEAGREGSLVWLRRETSRDAVRSPERFEVYATLWGRVDSPWVFSIQADTREAHDALLAAFVAAARSSPR